MQADMTLTELEQLGIRLALVPPGNSLSRGIFAASSQRRKEPNMFLTFPRCPHELRLRELSSS